MVDQFTNIVGGFEQCEPPFCSQDFQVDITQFECNNDVIYVGWTITDQYNRSWTPSLNVVQYSLNEENFNNSQQVAVVNTNGNNYSTYFNKPGDGLLYIKIKVQINFIFIEGYPENHIPLNTDTCVSLESVAVPVGYCPETPFSGVPIYVAKAILPIITSDTSTTFYFQRGNFCLFVDKDLYDAEISFNDIDYPTNAILVISIPIDTIRNSCEACFIALDCPSLDWIPDPLFPSNPGKDLAEIYVEYTTYNVRDEVIIYGPDPGEDCSGTQIWTSTCVGTCRGYSNNNDDCNGRICEDGGEGPGIYLRGPSQFITIGCEGFKVAEQNLDNCVKWLCITVRREQLPIGIEVISKCDEDTGTWWCAYAEGPDFTYCKCAGISDCDGIVGSSESSASSESDSSESASSESASSESASSESASSESASSESLDSSASSESASSESASSESASSESASSESLASSASSDSESSESDSSDSSVEPSVTALILINDSLTEDIEEKINNFYNNNPGIFDNKTSEEKEDIILEFVGSGNMIAEVAIRIAIREGIEVE